MSGQGPTLEAVPNLPGPAGIQAVGSSVAGTYLPREVGMDATVPA
jgi:hypothetical protein